MTILKLFKELKIMEFVGVKLFKLSVKSNPGLCIYFLFLSLLPYWSRKLTPSSWPIRCRTKVSRILVTRVFFPAFFRFLFIYIRSKYALIFCLGRVTLFRLFKLLKLAVLIISKVVDAFFTKWRNISLQPHSLLPF